MASFVARPPSATGLVEALNRFTVAIWHALRNGMLFSYSPEQHYMRGGGPKWYEKHAAEAGCTPTSAERATESPRARYFIMLQSGQRRAEIMAFLSRLSAHEKLMVLTHLAEDAGIRERIPDGVRRILNFPRTPYRAELLKLPTENSNLDLEFLARRKGCRLEPVEGPGDRWRIIPATDQDAKPGDVVNCIERTPLPRKQALNLLRSLPDRSGARRA